MCVLVARSCLTPWDSMDCCPPGFSVPGILQARILEWVATPFYRGPSWPRGSNPGLLHCRQILFTVWATREAIFKCINSSYDWATFSSATFKFKSLLSGQNHFSKALLYLQPRKCRSFAFWDEHATLVASVNVDPGLSMPTEASFSAHLEFHQLLSSLLSPPQPSLPLCSVNISHSSNCFVFKMYLFPIYLHSKGNNKQNEKQPHRLGENICKWCDW